MPRKTLRGKGWNSLFGIGPTKGKYANIYKGSTGVLVSRSKTQREPIFSRDDGKTWNYIFGFGGELGNSPRDDAKDALIAYKEMKANEYSQPLAYKPPSETPEERSARIEEARNSGYARGGKSIKQRKTRKHKSRK